MKSQAEPDLIRKALGGDSGSFGELADIYGSSVLALAYSRIGNYAASEDIAQDAFAVAFEKLDSLREPGRFGAWLRAITANLCRQWQRSQAYRRRLQADSVAICDKLGYTRVSQPDAALGQAETYGILDKALGKLPPVSREALTLFYLEEESIKTAAEKLDISSTAMRKRLERGRRHLREEITTYVEAGLFETSRQRTIQKRVMAAMPLGASFSKVASPNSILPSGLSLRIADVTRKLTMLPLVGKAGLGACLVGLVLLLLQTSSTETGKEPNLKPEAAGRVPVAVNEPEPEDASVEDLTPAETRTPDATLSIQASRERDDKQREKMPSRNRHSQRSYTGLSRVIPDGQYTVSGIVVTTDGSPVGGALMDLGSGTLIHLPTLKKSILLSDERGCFELHTNKTDGITVGAYKRGFRYAEQIITVPKSGSLSGVRLVLEKAPVIYGRVSSWGGNPVTNATIEDSFGDPATVTDNEGEYTFLVEASLHVYPTRFSIRIEHPDYPKTQTSVDQLHAGEKRRVNITMEPFGTIYGTVEDWMGNPVPNAQIQEYLGRETLAVADADGNYSIPKIGFPAKETSLLTLVAVADGMSFGFERIRYHRKKLKRKVNFVIPEAQIVRGKIVDLLDNPVQGAALPQVYVEIKEFGMNLPDEWVTINDDGTFKVRRVPEYKKIIFFSVSAPGFVKQGFTFKAKDEKTIVLAKDEGKAAFVGRVVDAATELALEEFRVVIKDPRRGTPFGKRAVHTEGELRHGGRRFTAEDGIFKIPGFNVRELCLVEVIADGYVKESFDKFEITGSLDPVPFSMKKASKLSGKVITRDGVPVEGTKLTLGEWLSRESRNRKYFENPLSTTTGEKGEFEFVAVATGAHKLTVEHDEEFNRILEVTTEMENTITLDGGEPAKIVGTITDIEGNPMVGVIVTAMNMRAPTEAPESRGMAKTKADGTYEISKVTAGAFVLNALTMENTKDITLFGMKRDIPVELGSVTTVDWIVEPGCDMHVVLPDDEELLTATLFLASSPKDNVLNNDIRSLGEQDKLVEIYDGLEAMIQGQGKEYTVHGLPEGKWYLTVILIHAGEKEPVFTTQVHEIELKKDEVLGFRPVLD
ncbi:sigma-70 family RNA polymerase sigma factor [Candidatus Hydrogenedentota bacterium]